MTGINPKIVWGSLFMAGGLYEAYAVNNDTEGDTLSEVIRDVCRVDCTPGKAAFLVGYLGFSSWFLPHIALKAVEAMEEVSEPRGTDLRPLGIPLRVLRLARRFLAPTA